MHGTQWALITRNPKFASHRFCQWSHVACLAYQRINRLNLCPACNQPASPQLAITHYFHISKEYKLSFFRLQIVVTIYNFQVGNTIGVPDLHTLLCRNFRKISGTASHTFRISKFQNHPMLPNLTMLDNQNAFVRAQIPSHKTTVLVNPIWLTWKIAFDINSLQQPNIQCFTTHSSEQSMTWTIQTKTSRMIPDTKLEHCSRWVLGNKTGINWNNFLSIPPNQGN